MEQNSKIRQYRIGEYAKYMGVTPDFLKHYEQYHLVTSVTRESGYRYYPFNQAIQILECMRLRNYGITLKDMEVILNHDDFPTVQEKLNSQIEVLERKIQFEQAVIEEHRWFSNWMERMKDKTEDWCIVDCEEMLFLPHSNRYDFIKDERIYTILNDWVSWMPMVKSCMEARKWKEENERLRFSEWDYSWGLLVSQAFAAKHQIPVTDVVSRLPARKMFLYNFIASKINSQQELHTDSSHLALNKMRQLGLTPTGNLYKVIFMYTHTNSSPEQYGMIAIPID